MRRSISSLLLAAIAGVAAAQGFGRFGYTSDVAVPGFVIDRSGFRVNHPASDAVKFESTVGIWKPVQTTETSQTIFLGGPPRIPAKLKVDLNGVGFSLYVQGGISLEIGSLSPPFLSWKEGSVGPDVPTPDAPWVLVTFRDAQPPILIGFPEKQVGLQLSGKAGRWRLRSARPFEGWVRVVAPIGIQPFAANSVAQLGALVKRVKAHEGPLAGPIPKPLGVEYVEDPMGVEVKWTYDRPGALVPAAAVLAPLGGYPLRLLSETRRLDGHTEAGPLSVCATEILHIRLPVKRIPTGRSLATGAIGTEPPGSVSTLDVAGVFELALFNLSSQRDVVARDLASDTFTQYLGEASYELEPNTSQRLPFGANGKGLDLAAVHALLLQSTTTAERATSEPNSLLTSVSWRRDWYTWRLWCSDGAMARRAAALAALAGAICPEPSRRAEAGMLQAGLSAERGLGVWQRRITPQSPIPKLLEAVLPLRASFFALEPPVDDGGFFRSLLSEIRVYGEQAVSASLREGSIVVGWGTRDLSPRALILATAYPIQVSESANVTISEASEALGFTVIRYTPKEPGRCEIVLKKPEWASALPSAADPPRYEESVR